MRERLMISVTFDPQRGRGQDGEHTARGGQLKRLRCVVLAADANKRRVGGSASCCCDGSRGFCFDLDHLPVDGTPCQKINFICISPERTGGRVYRLIGVELIDEVLNLRRST